MKKVIIGILTVFMSLPLMANEVRENKTDPSGNMVGYQMVSLIKNGNFYFRSEKNYTKEPRGYVYNGVTYKCWTGESPPTSVSSADKWIYTTNIDNSNACNQGGYQPYNGINERISYYTTKTVNGRTIYARETRVREPIGNESAMVYTGSEWECFVGYPNSPSELGGTNGGRNWASTNASMNGCIDRLNLNAQ